MEGVSPSATFSVASQACDMERATKKNSKQLPVIVEREYQLTSVEVSAQIFAVLIELFQEVSCFCHDQNLLSKVLRVVFDGDGRVVVGCAIEAFERKRFIDR